MSVSSFKFLEVPKSLLTTHERGGVMWQENTGTGFHEGKRGGREGTEGNELR